MQIKPIDKDEIPTTDIVLWSKSEDVSDPVGFEIALRHPINGGLIPLKIEVGVGVYTKERIRFVVQLPKELNQLIYNMPVAQGRKKS